MDKEKECSPESVAHKIKRNTRKKFGAEPMNKDRVKLGIAPIGWTNDDMPDLRAEVTFEQCISEMALEGTPVPR